MYSFDLLRVVFHLVLVAGVPSENPIHRLIALLDMPLVEVLRAEDQAGSIELLRSDSEEESLLCDGMALSFSKNDLSHITGVVSSGRVIFCVDPSTYQVAAVSVVPFREPGVIGVPANNFLKRSKGEFKISRRPFLDVEDGLAADVGSCEQVGGEAEVWVFPELKMEAYIERGLDDVARIASLHISPKLGGTLPPCEQDSR